MRRDKLTPEVQRIICDAIEHGNTLKNAAAQAGISERTLYNWLERGRQAKSGKFFQFFQSVKKAESRAEDYYVEIIRRASRRSWQAAAWWLERRRPEDWRMRQEHQHEVTLKGPQVIKIGDMEIEF